LEEVKYVIMSDDGTGVGISIPSMLIGKTEGNKLISFLKDSSSEDKSRAALMV
jgi:hypothetical protein